jgi:hypothetical protein
LEVEVGVDDYIRKERSKSKGVGDEALSECWESLDEQIVGETQEE